MAKINELQRFLTLLGVEKRHIIPTNSSQKILRDHAELNQFVGESNIFPLEWFDDHQFGDFTNCRKGE